MEEITIGSFATNRKSGKSGPVIDVETRDDGRLWIKVAYQAWDGIRRVWGLAENFEIEEEGHAKEGPFKIISSQR